MFFTGNYERTLDGKGRLVLPPKVRSKLPEGGFLVPLNDHLGLYPADVFKELVDRKTEEVRRGEMSMKALRRITSSAEEVDTDAQGRVGIPPRLRTETGIETNDVVVVGANTFVEIWSASQWTAEAEDEEAIESANEVFARGFI